MVLRELAILQILSPHFHLALSKFFDQSQSSYNFNLTERECDVLRWVSEGKTSWEISQIFSISENTINFHITNIKQKMKADKIDIKTSYFVDRNGELEEIKLKKSTILKLMSDKKDEIKSFLNEHSLSFKKDPDIKEIFNYYNSII